MNAEGIEGNAAFEESLKARDLQKADNKKTDAMLKDESRIIGGPEGNTQ